MWRRTVTTEIPSLAAIVAVQLASLEVLEDLVLTGGELDRAGSDGDLAEAPRPLAVAELVDQAGGEAFGAAPPRPRADTASGSRSADVVFGT